MVPKVLRKTNKQGRLCIPKVLSEHVGLKPGMKVALCTYEEYGETAILLKAIENMQNCKVLHITKMNDKRQIVIPCFMLPEGNQEVYFEVYLFNDDLIIEEV